MSLHSSLCTCAGLITLASEHLFIPECWGTCQCYPKEKLALRISAQVPSRGSPQCQYRCSTDLVERDNLGFTSKEKSSSDKRDLNPAQEGFIPTLSVLLCTAKQAWWATHCLRALHSPYRALQRYQCELWIRYCSDQKQWVHIKSWAMQTYSSDSSTSASVMLTLSCF